MQTKLIFKIKAMFCAQPRFKVRIFGTQRWSMIHGVQYTLMECDVKIVQTQGC